MNDQSPLLEAARNVVFSATQDRDGYWFISGDGEALITALSDAVTALASSPAPLNVERLAALSENDIAILILEGRVDYKNGAAAPGTTEAGFIAKRIHARLRASSAPPPPSPAGWREHEDEIADAISDSMDMDWNGRDGALAVVRYLDGLTSRATAWLIEWPATKHEPVRYWHASTPRVMDPHDATWLVRKEDAEAVIKRDHIAAGARPVEHIFGLPLPAAPTPTGEDSAPKNTFVAGQPAPYFCPACQAAPRYGYCSLKGCPTAPTGEEGA